MSGGGGVGGDGTGWGGDFDPPHHPMWGILAKYEQKGCPQDRKAWAMQKAVGPTVRKIEKHSKISGPLVGNIWRQKPPDFTCGELTCEFSAILKIPKIHRISNLLSKCKKMEDRKVRLLMFFNFFL